MPTPHIHEKEIMAWAQGMQIEYEDCGWHDCTEHPTWDLNTRYRVKPAAPKWPQTTMNSEQMLIAQAGLLGMAEQNRALANAAIAHACEAGQVVPNETVNKLMLECHRREGELRKALVGIHRMDTGEGDMAIAINVRAACHAKLPGQVTNDELNRIISGTK